MSPENKVMLQANQLLLAKLEELSKNQKRMQEEI
jgi:hypothetical protein